MSKSNQNRREFLSTVSLGTIGTLGAAGFLANCTGPDALRRLEEHSPLHLSEQAPDGRVLKAGVVGCGGRGTGAAVNFVDAGPNLEIAAMGDLFRDQLERSREHLKQGRNINVPDDKCFHGFDNYKKVIDSGIDVLICAAPPYFRPEHVKAAVDAGIHVFQEKPIAVDPVGARIIMEATQIAKEKNLSIVSGTIRRYQKDYIETQRRVARGEIGDIVGANILRNGGALWWIERRPEWTDMEYMIRNWGNFTWLSGDHIVEQFIHELDAMSWHVGGHPQKAIGYGGRHQRQSGDQFDQFSVVYEYENGMKAHCATRQIDGIDNRKTEMITGTKGYVDASGSIYNHKGEQIWQYPYPNGIQADQHWVVNDPYVQEHVEFVTSIRNGEPLNDSEEQVKSTRIGIMGRMAAYTGREITWEEVLNSDLQLGPGKTEFGPVSDMSEHPPAAGTATPPTERYSDIIT